jgi:hypothetical protein
LGYASRPNEAKRPGERRLRDREGERFEKIEEAAWIKPDSPSLARKGGTLVAVQTGATSKSHLIWLKGSARGRHLYKTPVILTPLEKQIAAVSFFQVISAT